MSIWDREITYDQIVETCRTILDHEFTYEQIEKIFDLVISGYTPSREDGFDAFDFDLWWMLYMKASIFSSRKDLKVYEGSE